MSSESLNCHNFNLKIKLFQQQAISSALEEAEQLTKGSEKIENINITSRTICKVAFNSFKQKIKQEFTSNIYINLIDLTLKSRETMFFVELNDRILKIIS